MQWLCKKAPSVFYRRNWPFSAEVDLVFFGWCRPWMTLRTSCRRGRTPGRSSAWSPPPAIHKQVCIPLRSVPPAHWPYFQVGGWGGGLPKYGLRGVCRNMDLGGLPKYVLGGGGSALICRLPPPPQKADPRPQEGRPHPACGQSEWHTPVKT